MITINKINSDSGYIEYLDPYNQLISQRPFTVGTRARYQALPVNYWTLSTFVDQHAVGTETPWFTKVYDKLKSQYELMQSLKPHSIHEQEQVEQLAANIHISEYCDATLYPYQKIDAYLCASLNSFANFNCMRSGKTMTTCAALELRRQNEEQKEGVKTTKVILSIVQSTSRQWIKTLHEVCPAYKIFDVSQVTNKQVRWKLWHEWANYEGYAVMISNRDKLKIDIGFKATVKNPIIDKKLVMGLHYGIVTDEFHFCKGVKTIQSKCHYFLSEHADFTWGLTGTKMSNNASDLYGILKYLKPHEYGSEMKFQHRYLIEDKKYFGGRIFSEYKRVNPDTKAELFGILYMLSVERQEEEVLHWVPKIQTVDPPMLEMTKYQEHLYHEFITKMEVEIGQDFISLPNAIALRSKLLQISSTANAVDVESSDIGNKEQWFYEWIKDNLPRGAVPVVFGRFTNKVLRPMSARLSLIDHPVEKRKLKVGMIDGQTLDKSMVAEEFQKGVYDILICNIKSGGTGLTLDRGDTAIFFEREDNLADNIQAEKRILHTRKDDFRIKQIIHLLSVTKKEISVDLMQWANQHQKLKWVQEMYPDKMTAKLLEFEQQLGKGTI